MAPSIIYNGAAGNEVFLPGQIFVFGGFALRANSVGHLEQIDSYAPGHQISFGNLNYVADIRGDLNFQGFAAPSTAPALDPERVTRSEDGSLEPAGLSVAIELNTGEPERIAPLEVITKPALLRTLALNPQSSRYAGSTRKLLPPSKPRS